ncbi:MAG: 2-succinyl-5-enolpyruvyl-6-hydroxy-3-cyclohexene-1-carboxylic-acid synthase, partial [Cyclobacteriaceae bacterium]
MNPLRHQHIYDLAELCARHGIKHAVICPGSRSAPLVLGFANHKAIQCSIIPDERSAGFTALGIAQATRNPVVLICTSGTAAYNFAPAVAEAFFQEIPLIVCTADRPVEWIGQRDGQTIYQNKIYGDHVKRFFDVQAEDQPDGPWLSNRMMNEAIITSLTIPQGPVHLNFPFREPLYPPASESIVFGKPRVIRVVKAIHEPTKQQIIKLRTALSRFSKILIVAGQYNRSILLQKQLSKIKSIPIVGEVLSNLHSMPSLIRHADIFLSSESEIIKNELKPDLLITWGNGILSKNTKIFLRKYSPAEHWHLQEAGTIADTFRGLTKVIHCKPEYFVSEILLPSRASKSLKNKRDIFSYRWQDVEQYHAQKTDEVLKETFSEAAVVSKILNLMPSGADLHLANSMSVRHASLAGLKPSKKNLEVFSNRGTSGIDGCTSTVIGHQLVKKSMQVLITGDVAFFYDGNAFWNNLKRGSVRICLLNNFGGKIFKIIDGPKDRAEVNTYFVGPQQKNAEVFCKE